MKCYSLDFFSAIKDANSMFWSLVIKKNEQWAPCGLWASLLSSRAQTWKAAPELGTNSLKLHPLSDSPPFPRLPSPW